MKILAFLMTLLVSTNSFAMGECGMSCCLAGAKSGGIGLGSKFGFSFFYEYSYMETIKDGNKDISPDDVINREWSMGSTYKVPTEMIMKKYSFIGSYKINDHWSTLIVVPYIVNDMDMRSKSSMGMIMNMSMDTIKGIGDVVLMTNYDAYSDLPVRPTKALSFGFGLKLPTGKNTEVGKNGKYVHAMMQPGSGSINPIVSISAMKAWYPLVLDGSLTYQHSTKGDEGYQFGSQLAVDLSLKYQVHDYVNLGLEMNGIHAGEDEDREGKYTMTSSMIDTPTNTGLDSLSISPVAQIKIPNTGGNLQLKYQLPIYQEVNGYQQVLDWRILSNLTWVF